MQGVEVAQRTRNFSRVKPGSGLQEDPLPLEMVEQLEGKQNICQCELQTPGSADLVHFVWVAAHLSTVDVVQHKVEFVIRLEGVVQSHQEGVFDVLHQHAALGHDMLLLRGRGGIRYIILCIHLINREHKGIQLRCT